MTKQNQNRVWLLFVLAMLGFGIVMIIWTVKKSISLPVQESNNFMLHYQMADMNMNDILKAKKRFNQNYTLELHNKEQIRLSTKQQNIHTKRFEEPPIKLSQGENYFSYRIMDKDGTVVKDANVTFLLTRPHTQNEDKIEKEIVFKNGLYRTKAFNIKKRGRYTLQIKAFVHDTIGYLETPAYLEE